MYPKHASSPICSCPSLRTTRDHGDVNCRGKLLIRGDGTAYAGLLRGAYVFASYAFQRGLMAAYWESLQSAELASSRWLRSTVAVVSAEKHSSTLYSVLRAMPLSSPDSLPVRSMCHDMIETRPYTHQCHRQGSGLSTRVTTIAYQIPISITTRQTFADRTRTPS